MGEAMRRTSVIGLWAIVILAGNQGAALAQNSNPPALSPWLYLNQRSNTGPLDPYTMYVRPQIDLRSTLSQYDTRLNRQSTEIQSLDQQAGMAGRRVLPPTGVHSVFMTYSHYYPGGQPGGGALGPRQSRAPMPQGAAGAAAVIGSTYRAAQ
jgi:hypothetical protein